MPPFPVADGGTWRMSSEPFCDERWGWARYGALWSSDGAVVLAAGIDGPDGSSIYRNSGEGWTTLFSYDWAANGLSASIDHLTGTDAAGLLFGQVVGCDILRYRAGEVSCALRVGPVTVEGSLLGIVAEGEEIVALRRDGVYRYDGSRWDRPLEFSDEAFGVLAGRPSAYVVARGLSEVFVVREGVRTDLSPAPVGAYSAVAIDPATGTVWLATFAGALFRHDGVAWEFIPFDDPPCGFFEYVRKLWLGTDRLYFVRHTSFAYVDDGGANEVVSYACPEGGNGPKFRDIAGLADDEVFLLMEDPGLRDYACGELVMLWYDGNEIHFL